jgi:hypothetical protein
MTNSTVNNKKDITPIVSKIGYGAFVLLTIYFLATNQIMSAASNLGIALIFDPFNQQQKWNDRPLYQRVWLLVHVAVVFGLFIYGVMHKS